jgi:hypothetical protein
LHLKWTKLAIRYQMLGFKVANKHP